MSKLAEIAQMQQRADQKRSHVQNQLLNERFLGGFSEYSGWSSSNWKYRKFDSTDENAWHGQCKLERIKDRNAFGIQIKMMLPQGGEVRTRFLLSIRQEKSDNENDIRLRYDRTFLGRSFVHGESPEVGFDSCISEIKSQIDASFLEEQPVITLG